MNSYYRKQNHTPQYIVKFERTWLRDPQKETPENTVAQRLTCVKQFDIWLSKDPSFRQKNNGTWNEVCRKGRIFFVDKETLKCFFAYLHGKDYSVSTRIAYRASLKMFFDYALDKELIGSVPSWAGVFIRKTESERKKEGKKPLTFNDVQAIRNYLQNRNTKTPKQRLKKLRDMALLECLAATGARVGEIIQILVENIDFERGEVRIFGQKTSQTKDGWRIVPLQRSSCDIIRHYLETIIPNSELLFPDLKEYNVKNIVVSWRNALGISNLSPHLFRHYTITRLCQAENGNGRIYDINEVAEIVGCEPMTIHQYYYHIDKENVVRKFHSEDIKL